MVAGTLSTSTPRWMLAAAAASTLPLDQTSNVNSTRTAGTSPSPTLEALLPSPSVHFSPSDGQRAQTTTGRAATTTVSFTSAASVTSATASAIRRLRRARAAPARASPCSPSTRVTTTGPSATSRSAEVRTTGKEIPMRRQALPSSHSPATSSTTSSTANPKEYSAPASSGGTASRRLRGG